MATSRVSTWLAAPVDAASSHAFRALFGALMVISTLRFAANGWIDEFYIAPRYHFGWPGFEWLSEFLPRAPPFVLYLWFAIIGVSAACVMLGFQRRASALVFFVAFAGSELFDKTYYLNHYYLAALVAGLLAILPLDGATVPRAVLLLLRGQLLLVYFFAGLAKLDTDWLLRAEPLATWLARHAGVPIAGSLLAAPATAYAASWAGVLFDLTIPLWLCLPKTRGWAVVAVAVFHAVTGLLLPIGIFPWLMIALCPIFLSPSWPAPLLRRLSIARGAPPTATSPRTNAPFPALYTALLGAYLLIQLLIPLRHLLYAGPVNWTEEGFRFAWRVMLIEKTGRVELRVRDPKSGRQWSVSPRDELTVMQTQMMSTQPDMIAQYARHIAAQHTARGLRDVEVYADSWVSLNGRPAQRFMDPSANLALPECALAPRKDVLALTP